MSRSAPPSAVPAAPAPAGSMPGDEASPGPIPAGPTPSESARSKDRYRRAALSFVTGVVAKGGTTVATLIALPMLLDALGPTRFGLWMTIASLLAVLAFADLGIGNGLVNAVARHAGRDDPSEVRARLSSAAALLVALAMAWLAVLAVGFPLIAWDRVLPAVPDGSLAEFGPAAAMVAGCVALGLPFAAILRVQAALQKGYAAQGWLLATNLVAIAIVVTLARSGGSLASMALAVAGVPVLANALNALLFFRAHAAWRLKPRDVDLRVAGQIVRAGLLFLVPQLALSLGVATDSLLIARFIGADAVADYVLPAKVFALIGLVAGFATAPLWPAYAEALGRGDRRWVREAFLRSLAVVTGASALAAIVLALAMPAIVERWIGRPVPLNGLLLAGLAAWSVAEACGIAVSMLLNGLNALRVQALLALGFAIGCIGSRVALLTWAPGLGSAAVPIGAAIAYTLLVLVPYAWITRRHLREALGGRAQTTTGADAVRGTIG